MYASNVSQERKLLWRSLNSMLDNGRPSLLMGDFNVCHETNQSTSIHSIMDGAGIKNGDTLRLKSY